MTTNATVQAEAPAMTMETGYMVTHVQCDACKQGVQTFMYCETLAQIEQLGKVLHKSSGIICSVPKLTIVYSGALIDPAHLDQLKAAALAQSNGKLH